MKRLLVFILISITALLAQQAPVKKSLGLGVNSRYDELAPILSPDGQTLFFCREGDPRNAGYKIQPDDQDIWFSTRKKDGKWSKARHISAAFNSRGYDFPIGTSADGKTLYIGNTYGTADEFQIGSGVSKTRLRNGLWSFPEALDIIDYYNEANLVNYSMGADEKTIILNLQRRDTKGKMDLYVSFLQTDGKWSAPLNIGDDVNTPYQEVTPFIASDLKTLYFASNRPNGFGGFDMYVSRRLSDSWQNWSEPQNLGPGINTKTNDISYIIAPSGEYAIFASEAPGRGKDLFSIELPKKFRPKTTGLLAGLVRDDQGQPQGAQIIYERLSDGKLIGVSEADDKSGEFKISLPLGEKYSLRAEKKGYLPSRELIDLSNNKAPQNKVTLTLTPIKTGSKITLNSIFFRRRSFSLTKSSFSELDRLVKIIKENPQMKIEVAGHTDSVGSNKYNQYLSVQRARAVVKYLLKKGVTSNQVVAKGYGETRPVATNKTVAGRQKNRRVEFVILKQTEKKP